MLPCCPCPTDVRAGQALTGTVSKVEDFGLVVAITPSVRWGGSVRPPLLWRQRC